MIATMKTYRQVKLTDASDGSDLGLHTRTLYRCSCGAESWSEVRDPEDNIAHAPSYGCRCGKGDAK